MSTAAEPTSVATRVFDAVVIGVSAGAIDALNHILPALPLGARFVTLVVVHISPYRHSMLAEIFARRCALPVHEAVAHAHAQPGTIVFAASDHHLVVEPDRTLGLSSDPARQFSPPSIDALFESAARAYGDRLCAVVLTGASTDGVAGAQAVQRAGGAVVVQDPDTAEAPLLPRATLQRITPDAVLPPADIGALLHAAARAGD